ncbi:hypothetical protein DFJ77DRAFT_511594 [Powellomyces hirtus]|nr:hypothetical protein DFJ77DRAFT_511594 [Powellomyces hirtus]
MPSHLTAGHSPALSRQASTATIPNASKYKNAFSATPTKALYTHLKIDATAPTKLKCNDLFFAAPMGNGNLGVFPMSRATVIETLKVEVHPPLLLPHGSQIQDFEFSPSDPLLLATSTRTAGLVRLWKIPTDVSPQPVGRVIDAATGYLAAHERRVEVLKFHPTVGSVLASGAMDATVRLWNVEAMQDRITLDCPDMATPQSLAFDYCGDALAVAASDANMHVFDPRAQVTAVQTAATMHIASKPIRLTYLTPDRLITTTGFTKLGTRELALWDVANLSTPLQRIVIDGTGVGALQPLWDTGLPVLYCASKGEGLRLYELTAGLLRESTRVGMEKQATAVDLLPKSHCEPRKCEIARFLRLGTDNSVETTSVHIPRANGETHFQHDLYPPIPVTNPASAASSWFDNFTQSIEPVMIDMVPEPTMAANIIVDPVANLLLTPEAAPTIEELLERHNDTFRRKSTVTYRRAASTVTAPGSVAEEDAAAAAPPPGVYHSGPVMLEKHNWIGLATWEPHYMALKNKRLYVLHAAGDDVPVLYIPMAAITKLEGVGDADLVVEAEERTVRARVATRKERDAWVDALRTAAAATGLSRAASVKSLPMLPALPRPRVGANACLMGNLRVLAGEWAERLVVLDEEGMLHMYLPDIKAYTTGKKAPLESIDLTVALSVRLVHTASQDDPTTSAADSQSCAMVVNTPKRILHLRTRSPLEATNWVDQIRRVVTAKSSDTGSPIADAVIEGSVQITDASQSVPPGSYWLALLNGGLYYTSTKLSTIYSAILAHIETFNVTSATAFRVSGTTHHVQTAAACDAWVTHLEEAQLRSFDILHAIGTTRAAFKEKVNHAIVGRWWGEGGHEGLTWVDEACVEKGESKVLFAVCGKTRLVIKSVPAEWESLRCDSAFVLDYGQTIYHWNGSSSSRVCRARALDLATRLRKSRSNRPRVLLVNDETDRATFTAFRSLLTTNPSPPPPPTSTSPASTSTPTRIFRTTAIPRQWPMVWVYQGTAPSKTLLESETAVVLVAYEDVFVWTGTKSSPQDRIVAGLVAAALAKGMSPPMFVRREGELRESVLWKEKFIDYEGSLPISLRPAALAQPTAGHASGPTPPITLSIPHTQPTPPTANYLPSGGVLTKTLTTHFTPSPQNPTSLLFSGETYIFEYTYRLASGRERRAVFFWVGASSGMTGGGAGAMLAVETARMGDANADIVRVLEGKEPPDLCALFPDPLIIRLGQQPKTRSLTPSQPIAFDIRETRDGICKATEVEIKDTPFYAAHVNLFLISNTAYIWTGSHCTTKETQCARDVAQNLLGNGSAVQIVPQGSVVPPALQTVLTNAGRSPLQLEPRISVRYPVRAFVFDGVSGQVKMEEIYNIIPDDLSASTAVIVDTLTTIYVWFGATSRPAEKITAMQSALAYTLSSAVHPKGVDLVVTQAGAEPPEFRRLFAGRWTPDSNKSAAVSVRPLQTVLTEYTRETYSVDVLLGDDLPQHLDVTKLEAYLETEAFEALFGMQRDAYLALPLWKRDEVKKRVGVF